jgi:hypothetical protein
MSFRKEKKYRLTINEYFLMKEKLYNEGMIILHKSRRINSIYFDNLSYDMFNQSEEGVVPRKKVRVRWYENKNIFKLEEKISSIEGRFKISNESSDYVTESDILKSTIFDKNYGTLYPALMVSYDRAYYILKNMRITFDSNINYKNLKLSPMMNYLDPERVVEIKTSMEYGDDFIEKLIPYSTMRFSKYSRGLLISQRQLGEF